MELLILLLLSPVAFTYGKSTDPNDEPFLPIYPVYPYSPKLIKRGTERDGVTQLTPELYTPKVEAHETYSGNLGTNYARDPYYPTYNPYPKATTSSSTSYSPQYYGSNGYSYSNTPYNVYNSYASTPYSSTPYSSPYSMSQGYSGYSTIPYSSGSYPSYYYQPPYYYPNYYTQPLFAPPPPVPGYDYSNYKDAHTETDSGNKESDKKASDEESKGSDSNQKSTGAQFVDGGNYISGNSKDLDSQPSTQKAASPHNQLEQVSQLSLKGLPIPLPKTTYRVISVAGQPVGPDYPLPAPYARAQQLEQLMSQTIANLLAHNPALRQQHSLQQQQHQQQRQQQQQQQQLQQQQDSQYSYDINQNALPANNNEGSYINTNNYKDAQPYVSIPNVLAKTGLAYVNYPNLIGKLSAGQATRQTAQPPTSLTTLTKTTDYASQPIYDGTQNSQKDQTSDEQDDYDNYESQTSTVTDAYDKQNQAYDKEPAQSQGVYQNQNYVTVRSPQSFNYQYTSYSPGHRHARKPSQRYKSALDDVNFGSKQTNKG